MENGVANGGDKLNRHRMPTSIASPELTGGAGFTFEDRVAAMYLAAVLAESVPIGLLAGRAIKVELQRAAFGQPMDDLIVTARLQDDSHGLLAMQVKRALTVSPADSNADFRDVVRRAWSTIRGTGFRSGVDRVGAVTGSIAEGRKRALRDVCEWARLSPTAEDFESRFVPDASGEAHRHVRESFTVALKAAGAAFTPADLHRLLASFVIVSLDLLHEGASDEAHAINLLGRCLVPTDAARSGDLFGRLTELARDASGRAGQFTRTILIHQLRGRFRLVAAPSFHGDLARLNEEALRGLAEIEDSISGLHVPRTRVLGEIEAVLKVRRFVQVTGLPGSGKSVVLRTLVQRAASAGTVLFLKADRLQGRGWNEYATGIGLHSTSLATLLAEIAAAGTPTLFIDGLDRVEVEDRPIVNDILNLLAEASELRDWRVVATVRDNGMEPLRTWLSPKWLAGGASNVNVAPLNDEEANAVATAHPSLRPLLVGSDPLRELMRRPFFLSVAARLSAGQSFATEADLIEAWWRAGATTLHRNAPVSANER